MKETLVLGLGNSLLRDEGIGPVIVQALARMDLPEHIRLLDGGTLSFTLAPEIEAVDHLLVIDCTRMGEKPGSVRCFEGEEMDAYIGSSKGSVHEVGLTDLMDIARLTDSLPSHRALIGIQPKEIGWGDSPTPELQAAIAPALKMALDLLDEWELMA